MCETHNKLTYQYVKSEIEKRKGMLISDEYINNSYKLEIICDKGHTFFISWAGISQGQWCRYCRLKEGSQKCMHKYEFIKEEVEKRGGKLITKKHVGCFQKLEILGDCGHTFCLSYAKISSGRWCKFCNKIRNKEKLKHTYIFVEKTISDKGGRLLTKEYINNKQKLEILCLKCEHIWSVTFADVYCGEKWCPKCAHRIPHTIIDCQNEAKTKGGKCISTEYKNSDDNLIWECAEKHIWMTTFNAVKNAGHWCPECALGKTQRHITDICREIFPFYHILVEFDRFWWLINEKTGMKFKFDIYIPELCLAMEYDGEQHFMPVKFYKMSETKAIQKFKDTKKRDKLKNKKVSEHPEDVKYFVRFNYKEKKSFSKDYISKRLSEIGVPI